MVKTKWTTVSTSPIIRVAGDHNIQAHRLQAEGEDHALHLVAKSAPRRDEESKGGSKTRSRSRKGGRSVSKAKGGKSRSRSRSKKRSVSRKRSCSKGGRRRSRRRSASKGKRSGSRKRSSSKGRRSRSRKRSSSKGR